MAEPRKVSHFDVMKEMAKRDLHIHVSPLSNIGNMRKTKHGTKVEIGVGMDCILGIISGDYYGGLYLMDRKEYEQVRKELEEAHAGTNPNPPKGRGELDR